jgi:hypothetical protein
VGTICPGGDWRVHGMDPAERSVNRAEAAAGRQVDSDVMPHARSLTGSGWPRCSAP